MTSRNYNTRRFMIFGWVVLCGSFLVYKLFLGDSLEKLTFKNINSREDPIQNFKMQDKAQSNIAFLKTQKCGSSTMACLLLRYGFLHNLTMYLPHSPRVTESTQTFLIEKKYKCNIFATHTNYSYNFFTQIVNHPTIIGLIREPERRLISHTNFFLLHRQSHESLPLQDLINEVAKHSEKYRTMNVMSQFFRIPERVNSNSREFKEILNKLDSEFHLVLILERFDESLILLKRMLNWKIVDIIYKKKKNSSLKTSSLQLDNHSRRIFQQSNKKDYVLYDFFSKKLNQKIIAAGKDLQDEVLHFKTVSKQAESFCLNGTDNFLHFPPSKWDDSFVLSRTVCHMIHRMDVGQFKKRNYTIVY